MNETEIKNLLVQRLKEEEGYKPFPYKDSVGKLTIGVGRNIEDNGLRDDEIEYLLRNDIEQAYNECSIAFNWFPIAPAMVKIAVVDMCFNMGLPTLLKFDKMILAFTNKEYAVAASEMLNSKWAKQVGDRAKKLADLILSI